jgi:hypothetical protein
MALDISYNAWAFEASDFLLCWRNEKTEVTAIWPMRDSARDSAQERERFDTYFRISKFVL